MDILNNQIDELKNDLLNDIVDMVKIPSVEGEPLDGFPFGKNVGKALEKALEISQKLGFKTKNIDGYMGYAEFGEGEDYIAVVGHLDVVPEGSGWKYEPYGGEIDNGKIYGRGVLDNKGPIISALYGLKAIANSNIKLDKKVRIIFGTNEETGFNDIPYYLSKEKPPIMGFTPDCKYPVVYGERGIGRLNIKKKINLSGINAYGDFRSNVIPDNCNIDIPKIYIHEDIICYLEDRASIENDTIKISDKIDIKINSETITISAYGKQAPANAPQVGENAITNVIKYLLEENFINDEELNNFFKFIDKYFYNEYYGEKLGINFEDKLTGKLYLAPYELKCNNEEITFSFGVRYPMTCKIDYITDAIKKVLDFNIVLNIERNFNPVNFDKDSHLVKSLQLAYERVTGLDGTPTTTSGGTYAKVMPNIVPFGPSFPGQKGIAHNHDEYMDIDDIILNAKIFANAIYELAKEDKC
ncbi:dipeptidase PepV [Paeniclostridium hominis]|uniref:dipeptidase PepV n=1 Tax=Paeniclostridium hominis TaxID=2764329 RepID=UPI0022E76522|nr:dipeptidase PepV [Paeniclostridium hominis]